MITSGWTPAQFELESNIALAKLNLPWSWLSNKAVVIFVFSCPIKWTNLLGMSLNLCALIHAKTIVDDLDEWSALLISWLERMSKKCTESLGCHTPVHHISANIPANALITAQDSLFNKLHETLPGKNKLVVWLIFFSLGTISHFFLISWFEVK